MTLLTKGEKMSNTNTPSLKASIKEYEESTTETFLGKIQKPELVDKYLGRMMLQLKFVESGGASKQTRSIDLSDSHISNLADSLEREIQYDQPPLMVFKSNEEKYVIVQGEHRLQALKRLGFEYTNKFNDSTQFEIKTDPIEFANYIKLKYEPSELLIVEPGLRLNLYNVYPDSIFPDFRLGLKYILTENRYLNFSVGNYHQFISTFQDDFNPPILDNWIAADTSVSPGKSKQIVLGYEEYFKNIYKLQIEGYYKDLKNLLTYEETSSTTDSDLSDDNLADILTPADGYAYGFEIFGQKMTGDLSGWIAYTFSVSRKIMNSIFEDGEEEYYTNWDRTHALSILGNYQINKKWETNWRLAIQSGQAYTPILGYYVQKFPESPEEVFRTIPGSRNSGRYEPYSRLDIGAVYHAKIGKTNVDFFFQIINTLNRSNTFRKVYSLGSPYNGVDDDGDWEKDLHDANGNGKPDPGEVNVDESDEGKISERSIGLFPILPTFGFTWEF